MRRMLAWITAMAVLCAGCGARVESPMPNTREVSVVIENWIDCGGWTGEKLALQRRLVRWYHFNLRSDQPEPGYEERYHSILAGPGGVMGWVEFPDARSELPLMHEGAATEGFQHQKDTPFPVGDGGTAVLWLHSPQRALWTGWLAPEPGQVFRIHILDMTLTYRIRSVAPGREPEDTAAMEDGCILVLPGDHGGLVAVAIRENP